MATTTSASSEKILFTGVNITHQNAYNRHKRGSLHKIAAGIYIDSYLEKTERIEIIRLHACRIASTLYPASVISSISSWHLGEVNGTLHLTSSKNFNDINIDGVFDIKVERFYGSSGIPNKPTMIVDSIGKFEIKTMSPELVILMEMTDKSESKNGGYRFSVAELTQLVKKELAINGKDALLRRLAITSENLGFINSLRNAGSLIERLGIEGRERKTDQSYVVLWHKKKIGNIFDDGSKVYFVADQQFESKYFGASKDAWKMPRVFESLMNENRDQRDTKGISANQIKKGSRYLSNIEIVHEESMESYRDVLSKRSDYIRGSLEDFIQKDNIWLSSEPKNFFLSDEQFSNKRSSKVSGLDPKRIRTVVDYANEIELISKRIDVPKIPGMQPKLPMYLSEEGVLELCDAGLPFTHILKFPNNKDLNLCINEFFSTRIAEYAGLKVQQVALVEVPGFGASILMERFDIRRGIGDKSSIICDDFLSVLDLPSFANSKYKTSMVEIAAAMVERSTNREIDAIQLLKQVVISWVLGNGDMHAKNLSMITVGNIKQTSDISITLTPAYDMLSTQTESGYEIARSALPISEAKVYGINEFLILSSALGLKEDFAVEVIKDTCAKAAKGADLIGFVMKKNARILDNKNFVKIINKISEVIKSKSDIILDGIKKSKLKTSAKKMLIKS